MPSTEIEITAIEATGPVVKDPIKNRQGQYAFPAVYVLADGQRIATEVRRTLKRDAVAEHAALPAAPGNPMAASFNSDGEFWGTRTIFHLR